jgi:putative phosphoesterase
VKVGVIADIHSNLAAFEAVLKDMPRVDKLVCAGDLVGYGAEPNEVVKLAKSKGIVSVLGNHDYGTMTRDSSGFNPIAARALEWTANHLSTSTASYLKGLPLRLTLENKRVHLVHGSPRDPLFEYIFPDIPNSELLKLVQDVDAELIIFGHTHVPMLRTIQGKLVLNPGSVGQPRDRDPRASYALVELKKDDIKVEHRRVGYDIELSAKHILDQGLPRELAIRLHFGW